jgi:hypothetical protein
MRASGPAGLKQDADGLSDSRGVVRRVEDQRGGIAKGGVSVEALKIPVA